MSYKNFLKSKKACQGSDIPVIIIKENIDIITDFIYNNFNNSLLSFYFPSNLKNADTLSVKKKKKKKVQNWPNFALGDQILIGLKF